MQRKAEDERDNVYQNKIRMLEAQIRKLSEENKMVKVELLKSKENNNRLNDYENKVSMLCQEIQRLNQHIRKQCSQTDSLAKQIHELRQENHIMREKLQHSEMMLKKMENERHYQQQIKNQLDMKTQKIVVQSQMKNEEIEHLSAKIKKLHQENQMMKKQLDGPRSEKQGYGDKNLQLDNSRLKKLTNELKIEKEQLLMQLKECQAHLRKSKNEIDQQKQNMIRKQREQEMKTMKIMDQYQKKIKNLEESMMMNKNKGNDEVFQQLSNRSEKLIMENQAINLQNQELKRHIRDLQDILMKQRKQTEELMNNIHHLQKKFKKEDSQLMKQGPADDVSKLKEKNLRLFKENKSLTEELNQIEHQYLQTKKQLRKLRLDIQHNL